MFYKVDTSFKEVVNWAITQYGGALRSLAQFPESTLTTEEVIDLRERILKLNNNTFQVDKFNFNNLYKDNYLNTVLKIDLYEDTISERLWKRTDKEYVTSFKVNQKDTLSRKDVALFWFFRLILGVL
jgi:hypothetical protein